MLSWRSWLQDALRPAALEQDPQSAARDRLDYERSLALFTELVGTRFRLLGLLPVVSGAVIALLGLLEVRPGLLVGPALLGLTVTTGITVYEIRNSQMHDNLVHRIRHLERVLGLTPATRDPAARGGFFSERATRQLYLVPATSDWSNSARYDSGSAKPKLKVRHDAGLALVYGAVLGAWAVVLAWNLVLAVDAPTEAAWWVSGVAALVVFGLGWRTISASSMMGRNVGRIYLLDPLAERYANASSWPAALSSDLQSLDPPGGLLDDDAYGRFRAEHIDCIDFALSLGVVAHRRQLSKFRVRNALERNDDPNLRDASLAAIVGAREVDGAGDPVEAQRALIRRYGAQSAWCTETEVKRRVEWLEHLAGHRPPSTDQEHPRTNDQHVCRDDLTRLGRELWSDYESRQRFEHELIDRKTTWMLTTQSILFAAFGTSFLAEDSVAEDSVAVFRVVVASCALAVSAMSGYGVRKIINSKRASWDDYARFFEHHDQIPLPQPHPRGRLEWGVRTQNTERTLFPDRWIPWVFVLGWFVLVVWSSWHWYTQR